MKYRIFFKTLEGSDFMLILIARNLEQLDAKLKDYKLRFPHQTSSLQSIEEIKEI